MRARLFAAAALFVAITSGALAQGRSGDDYWARPDEEVKEKTGKLVFAVIKDRANFRSRVFRNGTWFTYYFRPHSEQIIRMEAPDVVEEYGYNTDGEAPELTIKINGRSLSTRVERNGSIRAGNLPRVSMTRDNAGRDGTFLASSGASAITTYGADDSFLGVTVNGLSLMLTADGNGRFVQSLRDSSGRTLKQVVAQGVVDRSSHIQPMCLDPVASGLGLGSDWENSLRFKQSHSSSFTTVTDRADNVILYVVSQGGHRFGFLPTGEPLFYDLAIQVSRPEVGGTGDVGGEGVLHPVAGVAPTRVVFTADGRAGACVSSANTGAIQSFWIEPDGRVLFRVVTGQLAKKSADGGNRTNIHLAKSAKPRTVVPKLLLWCGSTQVCTSNPDGSEQCGPIYNYYCEYGDSGGGTGGAPGSGTGGDGGGGESSPSNDVAGDPMLAMAVDNALSNASNKLTQDQCRQLLEFYKQGNNDGAPLRDALTILGQSATYYLNNSLSFINGWTTDKCSSSNATAEVGETTVKVCTSFKNLAPGQAGNVLIHEMLHTLGLRERPWYPASTNPTSEEISGKVRELCGS